MPSSRSARPVPFEGLQRNAMFAAFATLKDLDLVIAVDEDIDIRDPERSGIRARHPDGGVAGTSSSCWQPAGTNISAVKEQRGPGKGRHRRHRSVRREGAVRALRVREGRDPARRPSPADPRDARQALDLTHFGRVTCPQMRYSAMPAIDFVERTLGRFLEAVGVDVLRRPDAPSDAPTSRSAGERSNDGADDRARRCGGRWPPC